MSELEELEEFGRGIAEAAEAYLRGLEAVAAAEESGTTVPLLLLEVSQLLLAGAQLGARQDFEPLTRYQPDVGPDPDLDLMRLRLAEKLGEADTYAHNMEPYDPETVPSQLSDDLTLIATDVLNGLRHYQSGHVTEALWWWQYSYLASWGTLACGVLGALHSIVAHDRLDLDLPEEDEQIRAAEAVLDGAPDDL